MLQWLHLLEIPQYTTNCQFYVRSRMRTSSHWPLGSVACWEDVHARRLKGEKYVSEREGRVGHSQPTRNAFGPLAQAPILTIRPSGCSLPQCVCLEVLVIGLLCTPQTLLKLHVLFYTLLQTVCLQTLYYSYHSSYFLSKVLTLRQLGLDSILSSLIPNV